MLFEPHDFKPVSLGVRSNPLRVGRNYGTRLINCFAEENGDEHASPYSIYPSAGLVNFGTQFDPDGIRGIPVVVGSNMYVVAGRNVYRIDVFGNAYQIGGISTDGPLYMERNRRIPAQVGIVSDGVYYIIDTGANTVTEIDDVDLPPPNSLGYHDGFFLLGIPDGRWFISGLDDGTTVDALDFTSAESNPDGNVRIMGFEREVINFGEKSTEHYANTGNADFPYQRSNALNVGCLAGQTVASVSTKTTNIVLFVANDHSVRMLDGYVPRTISTNEIEELIKKYCEDGGDINEMTATAWTDGGRYFYALSCPDWTRVFDSKTSFWHDRESHLLNRWRISSVVRFGTKLVACDYAKGQLYLMKSSLFDEAGSPLISKIVMPNVNLGPFRFTVKAMRFNVLTGVGINSEDDEDREPVMMLKFSRDGGKSFPGYAELPLGRQAQTMVRPMITRLGKYHQEGMTVEVSVSAKIMRRFDQAYTAVQQLAA